MRAKKYGWIVMLAILAITFTAMGSMAANRDFDKAETIRIGSLRPKNLVNAAREVRTLEVPITSPSSSRMQISLYS